MTALVVDASVAAKWLFPEDGAEQAKLLFSEAHELWAPDLLWIEVAQIGWKYVRKGTLELAEVARAVEWMATVPVARRPSSDLLPSAVRLAVEYDRTVYDSLYLALAIEESCRVITADARLVNALSRTPLAAHLRLLGVP